MELREISLPDSLEVIPDNMLDNCVNLRCIYLPKNLKRIGDYAFARCPQLTYISPLPSGLKSVGRYVCVHSPVEKDFDFMLRSSNAVMLK